MSAASYGERLRRAPARGLPETARSFLYGTIAAAVLRRGRHVPRVGEPRPLAGLRRGPRGRRVRPALRHARRRGTRSSTRASPSRHGRAAAAAGARGRGLRGPARARVAAPALSVVHPGLQHRERRPERARCMVGAGRVRPERSARGALGEDGGSDRRRPRPRPTCSSITRCSPGCCGGAWVRPARRAGSSRSTA